LAPTFHSPLGVFVVFADMLRIPKLLDTAQFGELSEMSAPHRIKHREGQIYDLVMLGMFEVEEFRQRPADTMLIPATPLQKVSQSMLPEK
jgi:hypothetical protein